jgi:hypothetical protein
MCSPFQLAWILILAEYRIRVGKLTVRLISKRFGSGKLAATAMNRSYPKLSLANAFYILASGL